MKNLKIEKKLSINKLVIILAICFMGCSGGGDDDSPFIVTPDPDPDPIEEATLEGNYKGTWISTTSTNASFNVAVSSRLAFSGSNTNKLVGGFFISSNFTVCCSTGDNDGTLVIDFDGNTITSFRYTDVITDCSGTFVGTGTVRTSDGALVIDFTGNDCDGDHVGQIILKK
jgi:hypothetical protein